MATRRIGIDPTPPAAMTREQRRAELATIRAAGVIRHVEQRHCIAVDGRDAHSARKNAADSGETRLEAPPDPRPYGPRGYRLARAREKGERRALNGAKEIEAIKNMTGGQLRVMYEEVFGEATRAGNKDFVFKRIVWRLQSLAEGDPSERARKRAVEVARRLTKKKKKTPAGRRC